MSARLIGFLLLCFALTTLGGCQSPGRFQASLKAESDDGPANVALVNRQVHLALFYGLRESHRSSHVAD
jgi:hypothetical protein